MAEPVDSRVLFLAGRGPVHGKAYLSRLLRGQLLALVVFGAGCLFGIARPHAVAGEPRPGDSRRGSGLSADLKYGAMIDGVNGVDTAVDEALRQADEFFMGISEVHKTASVLAGRLTADRIDFAIAGALAVSVHGVQRMTEDVDILISREDLSRFKKHWIGHGYVEVRPGGKSVRDEETNVRIDFLIAGDFPGDGRPKPVRFPDPEHCRVEGERFSVLALPKLIEQKIASGMTAKDCPGDLQDVIRLIRAKSLSRDFQEQLDPYVRAKFLELWDAAQVASDEY